MPKAKISGTSSTLRLTRPRPSARRISAGRGRRLAPGADCGLGGVDRRPSATLTGRQGGVPAGAGTSGLYAPIQLSNSQASPPVFQKGARARPCYLSGAGYAITSPGLRRALLLPPATAEGMERRVAQPLVQRLAVSARFAKRARHSAPHRGFSVPGAVTSGRGRGPSRAPDPGSFRRPSSAPRPALAGVPLSGDGRRPRASRERGYEPRPQAPHLTPSSKRLAKTPSAEPDDRTISIG